MADDMPSTVTDRKPIVFTHANCPDGFMSAWVARRKLGDVDIRECLYDDVPPSDEDVEGRDVYFTDFCFNDVDTMKRIVTAARFTAVFDHHKTAGPVIEELTTGRAVSATHDIKRSEGGRLPNKDLIRLECHDPDLCVSFDLNRCGCVLTYSNLFSEATPQILEYVQDRDLWKWELPNSKAVNEALSLYMSSYEDMDKAYLNYSIHDFVNMGLPLLMYKSKQVANAVSSARLCSFAGHEVFVVNTPVHMSDVAGDLAVGRPFGVAWFQRPDGKAQVSLRVRDGDFDVSALAKVYGGGGHKKAAGFVVGSLSELSLLMPAALVKENN